MRFIIKLLLVAFTALCSQAQAQNFFPEQTDYAFNISADYDMPGNNLKESYKAGMGYSVSFLKYNEQLTYNISASYRTYGAKTPSLSETDPSTGTIGVFTMSPYNTFGIYAGLAYNIELAETIKGYGGVNLGMYFSNASITYRDDFNQLYTTLDQKQAYVAPKLGVIFALSNYLDLDLHAAYNVFTAGVQANSRTGTSGTLYTSIAGGLGLSFKF